MVMDTQDQWPLGHLAYVTAVNGNTITIKHSNVAYLGDIGGDDRCPRINSATVIVGSPTQVRIENGNARIVRDFLSRSQAISTPSISGVTPTSMPASNSDQTLTINGSNFQSGATLTFDPPTGANLDSNPAKLTFVSSTQIVYQINNYSDVGTWTVRVNNPGGQSSSPAPFTVTGIGGGLDYPGAIWDPAHAYNYTSASRTAAEIRWVVIHTTEDASGSDCSVSRNWFRVSNNPGSTADNHLGSSAHYVICRDGTVYQMVRNHDIAHHAGNLSYNEKSIGIEHERHDTSNWTEPQFQASVALVKWLATQCDIQLVFPGVPNGIAPANPSDGTGIIGHIQVPDRNNPTLGGGASHHTDPASWDWTFYQSLFGSTVNQPPTVIIVSPLSGATFAAPASIQVEATANDADGGITRVEFFEGATKLGEDTSAPYAYTWSNVPAGSYSLTAVATDRQGATAMAAVTVMVTFIPPPAGQIAFVSERDGNAEIYSMNADGSGQRRLTSNSSFDGGPAWSPDGQFIAFASGRSGGSRLFLMRRDGTDVQPVSTPTGSVGAPSWSPDGSKIAVSIQDDAGTEIWTMNRDGSQAVKLTTGGQNYIPVWSPGGGEILFRSQSPKAIIVMNEDGSNGHVLPTPGDPGRSSWSPNGQRIAGEHYDDGRRRNDLFIMDANGANTISPFASTTVGHDSWPTWSPDGARIAFVSTRDGASPQIFVVDADGTGLVRLTSDGQNYQPAWASVPIVNSPPTVAITSPTAGATFTAPATILIEATANDTDGGVTKVEFLNGATKLGEDTSAPYAYSWSNVPAGSYSLTAVATDTAGAMATSSPVAVTVQQRFLLALDASPAGGGSVGSSPPPGNDGKYAAGTVVTLTATPASGYNFGSWTGDASGTLNPVTVTMNGNRVVTAQFVQQRFLLALDASPAGGGSVVSSPPLGNDGKYAAGTVVTLTATPAGGYNFSSWSGDASGSDNPATVTMDIDRSVTANFIVSPVPSVTTEKLQDASEPSVSGSLTVIRKGDTSRALSVTYSVSGTATAGFDYQPLSGVVTVPSGANSAVVAVAPIDDAVEEGSESVTVTLTAGEGYLVGALASATLAIADDDAPAAERSVRLASVFGTAGQVVPIPILLNAGGNENALSFSVAFPLMSASYVSTAVGAAAVGGDVVVNSSHLGEGRIGIMLGLPTAQSFPAGQSEVAVMRLMLANGLPDGAIVRLEVVDAPIVREVVSEVAQSLPSSYVDGSITVVSGFEGDVAPRPNGDNLLTVSDWVQVGRFAAGLDATQADSVLQRADTAPRSTCGDGVVSVADWVQTGRFVAGLDPMAPVGGPTASASTASPAGSDGVSLSQRPLRRLSAMRELCLGVAPAMPDASSVVLVQLCSEGDESALGFSVNFDPTHLTFVSCKAGANAGQAVININGQEGGVGRVGFTMGQPGGRCFPSGQLELLRLEFAGPQRPGGTWVSFSDQPVVRQVCDASATELECGYWPTSVIITERRPRLELELAGAGVALVSWSAGAPALFLERTRDLGRPDWTRVDLAPKVHLNRKVVQVDISDGPWFYRLRQP